MAAPEKDNQTNFVFSIPGSFSDPRLKDPNANGGEALQVVEFDGSEGISQLFDYRVVVAKKHQGGPDLDFKQVLDQEAVFAAFDLEPTDQPNRYVYGIISEISLASSHDDSKFAQYQLQIVPPHYRMTLGHDMRTFQNKSTIDIVEELLKEAKLPKTRWDVDKAAYLPRNYCVQYRESAWSFVTRLLEEEGIAYHFESTADGVTLVFVDDKTKREYIKGEYNLPYGMGFGTATEHSLIRDFVLRQGIGAGRLALSDYVFKKAGQSPPNPYAEAAPQVASQQLLKEAYSIYDAPGEFQQQDLADRQARVRMEELESLHETATAFTNCVRLAAGYRFSLGTHPDLPNDKHPMEAWNREYKVVSLRCHGSQPQVMQAEADDDGAEYAARLVLLPNDYQFRPRRGTPQPRISGALTATVVGPKDLEQAIYTDGQAGDNKTPEQVGYGRVKVAFHWDRRAWTKEGKPIGDSSCWIRVVQPWAGKGTGALTIPRVGQEVLVAFVDGDPDRPVIVGCLYNGDQGTAGMAPEIVGFDSMQFDEKGPQVKRDEAPKGMPDRKNTSGTVWRSVDDKKAFPDRWSAMLVNDTAFQELMSVRAQRDLTMHVGRQMQTFVAGSRSAHIEGGDLLTVNCGKYTSTKLEYQLYSGTHITLRAADQIEFVVGGSKIVVTPDAILLSSNNVGVKGGSNVIVKGGKTLINGAAPPDKPTKTA